MIDEGVECQRDAALSAQRLVCFVRVEQLRRDYLFAHDAQLVCSPSALKQHRPERQVCLHVIRSRHTWTSILVSDQGFLHPNVSVLVNGTGRCKCTVRMWSSIVLKPYNDSYNHTQVAEMTFKHDSKPCASQLTVVVALIRDAC